MHNSDDFRGSDLAKRVNNRSVSCRLQTSSPSPCVLCYPGLVGVVQLSVNGNAHFTASLSVRSRDLTSGKWLGDGAGAVTLQPSVRALGGSPRIRGGRGERDGVLLLWCYAVPPPTPSSRLHFEFFHD